MIFYLVSVNVVMILTNLLNLKKFGYFFVF